MTFTIFDRTRKAPLPVIRALMNDADKTRYYIDPKTAQIVTIYSERDWFNRWFYNGLHSLNFPLALQLPATLGHRRHRFHAWRNRALRDIAGAGVESAWQNTQAFGFRPQRCPDGSRVIRPC